MHEGNNISSGDIIVTPMHITSRDWLKPKSSSSLRMSRNNGSSSVGKICSGESAVKIDETQEFHEEEKKKNSLGFDDMIASRSGDGTSEKSKLQETLRRLVEPTIDILVKKKDSKQTSKVPNTR